MHFHFMTYMPKPQHKNPCPGVMKLPILVDRSLVIITIYLVYLIYAWEQRRRFFKNNAFLLYELHGHALAQEPCFGGHEIHNYERPSLGLSDLCMGVWKKIFKDVIPCFFTLLITYFTLFANYKSTTCKFYESTIENSSERNQQWLPPNYARINFTYCFLNISFLSLLPFYSLFVLGGGCHFNKALWG